MSLPESAFDCKTTGIETLNRLAQETEAFTLVYGHEANVNYPGKQPIGKNWQNSPRSLSSAKHHVQKGGNAGIVTGDVRVLDTDCAHATELALSFPTIGKTCRVTRADAPDRAKFLFRCTDADGRLRNSSDHEAGAEFPKHAVVAGTHVSGAVIEMDSRPILDISYTELDRYWQELTGHPLDTPGALTVTGDGTATSGNGLALLNFALKKVQPGSRNNTGFELACNLRNSGFSIEQAQEAMAVYQAAVCDTGDHPYTEAEAAATLRSVYKHRPAAPLALINSLIDILQTVIVSGEFGIPANARQTAVGALEVMRKSKQLEDVAIPITAVMNITGGKRSTVADHLDDTAGKYNLFVRGKKSNQTAASRFTLSDHAKEYAKSVQFRHSPSEREVQKLSEIGMFGIIGAYKDLLGEAITVPGARFDARLVTEEHAHLLDAQYGAGAHLILAALAAAPLPDLDSIAAAISLSYRTTQRRTASLVAAGLVSKASGQYSATDGWRERLNELSPALVTFGRREMRAVNNCKITVRHHEFWLPHLHGDKREIALGAIKRANLDFAHWTAHLAERQRERVEYGLSIGLEREKIPAISLHGDPGSKRVRQPLFASKFGRKIIPDGPRLHIGKNRRIIAELPEQPPALDLDTVTPPAPRTWADWVEEKQRRDMTATLQRRGVSQPVFAAAAD